MALEIIEALKAFQQLLGVLGQQIWLPIFLFIIAVIFRAKLGRAFRAAIIIGVGWIGFQLVLGLFFNVMVPIANAMVERTGVHFAAVDVGWPVMAAIAYGTLVGVLVIPVGIIVNLILLALGLTKTFDIDIWNFWHWAFVGGTIMTWTGDLAFSLLAAISYEVFCLKVADWTVKPLWETFPGYKGYSIPQGGGWASTVPYLAILKPILDRIKLPKADPETVRGKLGVLGEPVIMGLIIGAIIAVAAAADPIKIAQVAISSAAVMLLLPRMIGILMEGLTAIADSVSEYFVQRFRGKRELYIGMDAAIAIGHPTTVAVGLLLIPITLLLAIVLPGVTVLPYADLAATPFFVVAAIPFFLGDFIKSLIAGIVIMAIFLYLGSWWSPIFTQTAISIGAIEAGKGAIGCIWLQPYIPVAVGAFSAPPGVNYLILILLIVVVLFADRIRSLREWFARVYKW